MPSEWKRVVFAFECGMCLDCDEPWCSKHGKHFADCDCIGPTQDNVEYKEVNGMLFGRIKGENE